MTAREVIAQAIIRRRADKAGGCFSDEDPESVDDCIASRCPCVTDSFAEADAILAALSAAGRRVVPVEVTEAMQQAAMEPLSMISPMGPIGEDAEEVWRAMLAAAQEDQR